MKYRILKSNVCPKYKVQLYLFITSYLGTDFYDWIDHNVHGSPILFDSLDEAEKFIDKHIENYFPNQIKNDMWKTIKEVEIAEEENDL